MPQWMIDKEEGHFWLRQDLESSKALDLGVLPPDIQMEELGQWVKWGPEPVVVQDSPPLAPLMEEP